MINIILGDATRPKTEGRNIIVHGCNSVGAWAAGFVLAVDKISHIPRIRYKAWARNKVTYCSIRKKHVPFNLGEIQLVVVRPKLAVCNLISQEGCGKQNINGEWIPPAKYSAINDGLIQLDKVLYHLPGAHIHLPMIGAGLGGLSFDRVYKHIYDIFEKSVTCALSVNIYGFTQGDYNQLKDIEKTVQLDRKDLTHGVSMV